MRTHNRVQKLLKEDAVLTVIDLQTRLLPAMRRSEEVTEASAKLIRGCRILGVQSIVTQQYTKGLGPTADAIKAAFEDVLEGAGQHAFSYIEKTDFSAMGEPEFVKSLRNCGKKSVIICGIEAHVCVAQTAMDLLEEGFGVFIVSDAVASRKEIDSDAALRRMIAAGAVCHTCESALFELLRGAREQGFKQISNLVK
jgi:nicotinamidase-related amidase